MIEHSASMKVKMDSNESAELELEVLTQKNW